MSHTLTLELPDEIWEPLLRLAEARGSRPEEWVTECLERAVSYENDPFWRVIGSISSGVPDLGLNHDLYLAEEYAGDAAADAEIAADG